VRPTARRAGMGPCGGAQENGPAAPPDRRNHRAVPGCHRGWPRRPSRRSRLLGVAGTEGNGPHGAGSGRVELRVFAGAVVGCRWRAFGSGPRGRRGGVPRRPAAWPGPDSRPAPPRRARLRAVYLYMRRRPPGPGAGRPPAPLTPDGREGRRTESSTHLPARRVNASWHVSQQNMSFRACATRRPLLVGPESGSGVRRRAEAATGRYPPLSPLAAPGRTRPRSRPPPPRGRGPPRRTPRAGAGPPPPPGRAGPAGGLLRPRPGHDERQAEEGHGGEGQAVGVDGRRVPRPRPGHVRSHQRGQE
jgi:hypothetical protein